MIATPLATSLARTAAHHTQRHLDHEIHVLEQFVAIAEEIRQALGRSTTALPENLESRRQQLLGVAGALHEQRRQLQEQLAQWLGLPASVASIGQLIQRLPPDLGQPLADRRARLLGLHEQVRRLTQTNSLLLQQSIDLMQRFLMELNGVQATATYTPSGAVVRSPLSGLVRRDC